MRRNFKLEWEAGLVVISGGADRWRQCMMQGLPQLRSEQALDARNHYKSGIACECLPWSAQESIFMSVKLIKQAATVATRVDSCFNSVQDKCRHFCFALLPAIILMLTDMHQTCM